MKKIFFNEKREHSPVHGHWRETEYLYMEIENLWTVSKTSDWNAEVNSVHAAAFAAYV